MLSALRNAVRGGAERRPDKAAPRWFSRDEAIMGTAIHVELWGDDRAAAERAIDAVIAEMHRIDALMSPYKEDSELSLINREAAQRPVQRVRRVVHAAGALARVLRTVARRVRHHVRQRRSPVRLPAPRSPDRCRTRAARVAIGYRNLLLDADARTVRFGRAGMRIDLGGFAKGHAVDNGVAILARHGVRHGVVAAGGDSRMLGDRCGRPWTVGVRDPRRADDVVALLPLEDVAVSTSGDYERYFDDGDERCHHLIDPRTGKSPTTIRSVTVIAPDGLTSEALSKTVFVLGVERGMQIVASLPGVDAVVVDAQGQLHYSAGLLHGGSPTRQ
jgi:FAD:protein FMN transferase